jgi:hypothetical protein
MLWRVLIILVGGGYVAYRFALAAQILKAKRVGDVAREQQLRTRGFGVYRWVVLCLLVFIVLLTALFWLNSR